MPDPAKLAEINRERKALGLRPLTEADFTRESTVAQAPTADQALQVDQAAPTGLPVAFPTAAPWGSRVAGLQPGFVGPITAKQAQLPRLERPRGGTAVPGLPAPNLPPMTIENMGMPEQAPPPPPSGRWYTPPPVLPALGKLLGSALLPSYLNPEGVTTSGPRFLNTLQRDVSDPGAALANLGILEGSNWLFREQPGPQQSLLARYRAAGGSGLQNQITQSYREADLPGSTRVIAGLLGDPLNLYMPGIGGAGRAGVGAAIRKGSGAAFDAGRGVVPGPVRSELLEEAFGRPGPFTQAEIAAREKLMGGPKPWVAGPPFDKPPTIPGPRYGLLEVPPKPTKIRLIEEEVPLDPNKFVYTTGELPIEGKFGYTTGELPIEGKFGYRTGELPIDQSKFAITEGQVPLQPNAVRFTPEGKIEAIEETASWPTGIERIEETGTGITGIFPVEETGRGITGIFPVEETGRGITGIKGVQETASWPTGYEVLQRGTPGRTVPYRIMTPEEIQRVRGEVSQPVTGQLGPVENPTGGFSGSPAAIPDDPQWSQASESLLALAKDTNMDSEIFQEALAQIRTPVVPPGNLQKRYNWVKKWQGGLSWDATVQNGYITASRYMDTQSHRIVGSMTGWESAGIQTFGRGSRAEQALGRGPWDRLVKGEALLRDLYTGPDMTGKAIDQYVGTLWHFLDSPQSYGKATPAQKRLVTEWNEIMNSDLAFNNAVGVPLTPYEGPWIAHSFVNREAHVGGSKAIQGFAKGRKYTTETFAEIAAEHNLPIDTDVMNIMGRRLHWAAQRRADKMFLDEMVEQTGASAKRLGPGEDLAVGTARVEALSGASYQFPDKIARDILQSWRPQDQSDLARRVETGVDLARGTLLNLDLSIAGARQGWLALSADPVGTIKGWGRATNLLMTHEGWTTWYATNWPRLKYASQHGLILRTSPLDINTTLRGVNKNILDRVPGVAQLNRAQFETVMPVLKLNQFDRFSGTLQALRDSRGSGGWLHKMPFLGPAIKKLGGNLYKMSDDELAQVAADAVNNWMGGIEWASVGRKPEAIRKLMFLTEGWTRAQIGALVNAPKLSPKGIIARRLIAGELAVGAAISTLITVTKTGRLPSYNPLDSQFLDVDDGQETFSMLPHKSLYRAVARLAGGIPEGEYGSAGSELGERAGAIWGFFQGRLGQVPRMVKDFSSGTDYFGRPIDNKVRHMALSLAPIVVGDITEDVLRGHGTPSDYLRRGVISELGTTPYATPQNELARQQFGVPYDE